MGKVFSDTAIYSVVKIYTHFIMCYSVLSNTPQDKQDFHIGYLTIPVCIENKSYEY
jgi:hypothetical protein